MCGHPTCPALPAHASQRYARESCMPRRACRNCRSQCRPRWRTTHTCQAGQHGLHLSGSACLPLSCKESEIGGRPREAPFSSFVPCLGVCSLAGSCTWSPPQARVCTRTPPCPSQPALPKCPALAAPVLRQQRCTEAHPRVQGSLWGVRYFPVHCGALPGVQVHSPWCPWWAISVQG